LWTSVNQKQRLFRIPFRSDNSLKRRVEEVTGLPFIVEMAVP
jgi:hypothetical protein